MMEIPNVFVAFAAGLLSFLSPCVLPLVPSYLAMLAGTTVPTLRGFTGGSVENGAALAGTAAAGGQIDAKARSRVFSRSLAFVAGFSLVFILLGLALSRATAMIGGASRTIAIVAGFTVILLGLNVAFDFLKILNFERRFRIEKRPRGAASAFLFGAAFGAGWSPCIGPMLASILLLAGRGSTAAAATLLGAYSLGLALPFLAAGLFFGRLEGTMAFLKKRMRTVKLISGLLLVLIGLSMLVGDFRNLSGYFVRLGYVMEDFAVSNGFAVKALAVAVYGTIALFALFLAYRETTLRLKRRRVVIALAFAALAILETLGLIRSAHFLASWLLFQGI